jgi:hypothetical protein
MESTDAAQERKQSRYSRTVPSSVPNPAYSLFSSSIGARFASEVSKVWLHDGQVTFISPPVGQGHGDFHDPKRKYGNCKQAVHQSSSRGSSL